MILGLEIFVSSTIDYVTQVSRPMPKCKYPLVFELFIAQTAVRSASRQITLNNGKEVELQDR